MGKLVAPSKRQLERNAKRFDGHDGHRADSRADRQVDQGVLFSVGRRYLVNHNTGKD